MKNNDLTPAEWEKIVINRAFGMSTEENAKAMELTRSGVRNVLNAFDCVKEQDWARACNLIVSRTMNIEVFKWSAEKCGVELPEIVVKAYEDYKAKRRAEKAAKMAEAQKAPEPVLPPAQQDDNNRLFFIRMLENMVKLNELMEQLMDVVIPKYVGDMKDNLNVNADVICERLKSCEDKLEAIKANTRKRGL